MTLLAAIEQYGYLLKWLGIVSIVTFTVSLLLIPWLIRKLPEDHFLQKKKKPVAKNIFQRSFHLFLQCSRNILGFILLLAGIIMLFLPGQGILTMLLGLSMLDFPGKHRFITTLLRRSEIRQALNWVRKKTGRAPFIWENDL